MKRCAILLVDDEKTILDSLKGQLKRMLGSEFVYEAAENVAEAWEVIDEFVDDGVEVVVIVSDWLMPGVKGDEFLCDVRKRHPQVATIMLTGQADAVAIDRVRNEAKVVEVMSKPWSERELEAVIRRAIAGEVPT